MDDDTIDEAPKDAASKDEAPTDEAPIPFDPACELCEAAPLTPRFYEDDVCWVAECESCSVPMVVWKRHDPNPPEEVRVELLTRLSAVVVAHYDFEHWVDPLMRSIPTHFHAHARPRGGISGRGSRRG